MNSKRPFSEKEFRYIFSKTPRITVEVIVVTENGVVLTLRDLKSWKGQWHIPGGTVFYKETLEEAVDRVARDEIGIKVKINKLVGYIYYPSEEKERGYGWTIGIAFLCTISSGQLSGSEQARKIGIFKKLPDNTIAEAKEFLQKNLDFLE